MTDSPSSPEQWEYRGSLLFLGGLLHIQSQEEGSQPANLENLGVRLWDLL